MGTYRQTMDWTKLLAGGKRIITWIKSKNPLYIIIFVLFGLLALQQLFPKKIYIDKPINQIVYVDKVVTHYDTIVKYLHKDVFIYDTIIETDTIFVLDSTKWLTALRDYYSLKVITDTLSNDSILFATSKYTLQMNALKSRDFSYQSRVKTEVINNVTIVNPLKNKVYATLDIGGGVNRFNLYAGLMLQTKEDRIFSAKYDPINKEVLIGTAFKLFQYGNSKGN